MVPVFGHMKFPDTAEKTASLFGLRDKPAVAKLLLDFMLDLLLLPYGSVTYSVWFLGLEYLFIIHYRKFISIH